MIGEGYCGKSGKEGGVIDVKMGMMGIKEMLLLVDVIMDVRFGGIVVCWFRVMWFLGLYVVGVLLGYGRLGRVLVLGCVG